jgi:cell division protein FtsL
MSFSAEELKKLAVPLVLLLAMLAAGAGLILWVQHEQRGAAQQLAGARTERQQAEERLNRIAEEEKEVSDKLAVYQRLKNLRILGEERRLEWADAMRRIAAARELLEPPAYTVGPRRTVAAETKPGNIEVFASTMKVGVALLHEGDLFGFLRDLRESGNAYYSIRRCSVVRTGATATGTNIFPRLRADCEIDLITIVDRAAKT